jgi:hypothetical protein
MLMQTFSKAVIVVDFYANQDVIARTLCENRDKPMLHCCGRCQLRKRLAREDNEKNSPERKPENKNPSLFTAAHTLIGISHLLLPPIRYAPSPSDNQTFDQPSFCFHPPD